MKGYEVAHGGVRLEGTFFLAQGAQGYNGRTRQLSSCALVSLVVITDPFAVRELHTITWKTVQAVMMWVSQENTSSQKNLCMNRDKLHRFDRYLPSYLAIYLVEGKSRKGRVAGRR